jgi:hypothetical protein
MSCSYRQSILVVACLLGAPACGILSRGPTSRPCGDTSAEKPTDQESLVDFVPDNAIAAFLLRRDALVVPHRYLAGQPALQADLDRFLVGVDLAAVDGLVVWATAFEENAAVVFLRIRQLDKIALRGTVVEQFAGTSLIRVDKKLHAAGVGEGILLGTLKGVKEAIDAMARPHAPSDGWLRSTLKKQDPGLLAMLAFKASETGQKGCDELIEQYGVTSGLATFGADHVLSLRLEGDKRKLQGLFDLIRAAEISTLAEAVQENAKAEVEKGVLPVLGGLLAFHETRRLFDEARPKFEGDALVSRYRAKAWEGATYLLGLSTALVIPALEKYKRKGRTMAVNIHLENVARAAADLYDAKSSQFTFPASTPWTPGADCCGQKGDECAFDPQAWAHPTWRVLGFSPGGPTYHQYRFVSLGKGRKASFAVEARGDLGCDQTWTYFSVAGQVGNTGEVEIGKVEKLERHE